MMKQSSSLVSACSETSDLVFAQYRGRRIAAHCRVGRAKEILVRATEYPSIEDKPSEAVCVSAIVL